MAKKVSGSDKKLTHSLSVQSDGKQVRSAIHVTYVPHAANRFNGRATNVPSPTHTMAITQKCWESAMNAIWRQ
jgi:hypothetical protein